MQVKCLEQCLSSTNEHTHILKSISDYYCSVEHFVWWLVPGINSINSSFSYFYLILSYFILFYLFFLLEELSIKISGIAVTVFLYLEQYVFLVDQVISLYYSVFQIKTECVGVLAFDYCCNILPCT